MINYIWGIFIILGIIFGTINNVNLTDVILSSCSSITDLIITLLPIMCFWLGIMKVAEDSGLITKLSKKISPLIKYIFPELKEEKSSISYISISIIMNFLGLGNAATPFGLKAMQELQKENKTKKEASNSMITFLVMTTSAVTIFPTSVIALRLSNGSSNPSAIITYSIIASTLALCGGLIFNKIIISVKKGR